MRSRRPHQMDGFGLYQTGKFFEGFEGNPAFPAYPRKNRSLPDQGLTSFHDSQVTAGVADIPVPGLAGDSRAAPASLVRLVGPVGLGGLGAPGGSAAPAAPVGLVGLWGLVGPPSWTNANLQMAPTVLM
eukprot:gene11075-18682_t